MKLFFAPLQGYTDATYRRFHYEIFEGCIDCYFSPFLRLEHGEARSKDLRDILPEANGKINLIPQIIAKDVDELKRLVAIVTTMGYDKIDLNVGCPFPMQVKRGRGAGLLSQPHHLKAILCEISKYKDVTFSIKMRLGCSSKDEWQKYVSILNDTPLSHVTLHPRVASQQYKGDIDIDSFGDFVSFISHPIVYNGDVTSTAHIEEMINLFPQLYAIMIGRGLLASPSLAWEWKNKSTIDDSQRLNYLLKLHDKMLQHYSLTLQGNSHLLMKMKSFWDFSEHIIGHKALKSIKKSMSIAKYTSTIANLTFSAHNV